MIRVVVVDDQAVIRAGVRAELEGRVEVVGARRPGVHEAVRVVAATAPDVVVLDVHMPEGGGVEVIRRVGEEQPGVRFLALSLSDTAEDVMPSSGRVRGYVTKSIAAARRSPCASGSRRRRSRRT